MEIKQLQKQALKVILRNSKRDGIKLSNDYLLLKLTEEVGEFVQSYLLHYRRCRPAKYLPSKISKREMAKELSDVFGIVAGIAEMQKIDLEEAFIKKWLTHEWIKK